MGKRRTTLRHRKQRSVLTDMLPFEVPPTFSNRGFYRFLRKHFVEIESDRVRWVSDSEGLDATMRLLFGIDANSVVSSECITEWGKTKKRRFVPTKSCKMTTIPFNFTVAHKLDGRTLSIVHPRNQVEVASFYANYSSLIIYNTSKSEFSIRKPVSVARYAYFKDKLHDQRLERVIGIEEEDREYEQLGSYFVYKKYRNIHRFFESYKYHRSEKKYNAMVQVDISKCFDSIYTHSLPWAVLGKDQAKFRLKDSKNTFGGRFDALMCNLNYGETNGIVIGPEFSRVFAEVVLQSIDADLQKRLCAEHQLKHKIDYEIFRYVDDYFIFFNEEDARIQIFHTLQETLRSKKLSVNSAKVKLYQKPIITEITIAKERISSLLNAEVDPKCEEKLKEDAGPQPARNLDCRINSNRLIVRYKAAIKESAVEYADLLNYTFAILENKLDKILKSYLESDQTERDRRHLLRALLAMLEFSFFVYSASPKTNHTIRLCRLISSSVSFLQARKISYDLKHLLFKYIHDNVMLQLEKNTMNVHREIESLYLLISLTQIGKEYWLPVSVLAKHFSIKQEANDSYTRATYLSHFSITVLLSYIKLKVRYKKLREFLEAHVVDKLRDRGEHRQNDAESLVLFLDLIVCPYIDDATKLRMAHTFSLNPLALAAIQSSNTHWFTAWGDRFDLGKELDAKRSREVY